jgi:hypothetical protein
MSWGMCARVFDDVGQLHAWIRELLRPVEVYLLCVQARLPQAGSAVSRSLALCRTLDGRWGDEETHQVQLNARSCERVP